MPVCLLVLMLLQRRGVLRPSQNLQRVTFTEVTQKAVKEALQHPRQVCHMYPQRLHTWANCFGIVCVRVYVCQTDPVDL